MANAPRTRPVEYYNPRPMILGLCFFWGIVMGFCLFYFAPPKQMMRNETKSEPAPVVIPGMSELERRHLDTPAIASVEPAPEENPDQRPRLEVMDIELPSPPLSTDGGLTGRTAKPLTTTSPQRQDPAPSQTAPPQWESQQQQYYAPPPIPELFP